MKVKRVCDGCGNEVAMQHYPQIAKIGEKVWGECQNCGQATTHTLRPMSFVNQRGGDVEVSKDEEAALERAGLARADALAREILSGRGWDDW
jgi:uncharacterized Zn finger protein